jgi:hypothetical protein
MRNKPRRKASAKQEMKRKARLERLQAKKWHLRHGAIPAGSKESVWLFTFVRHVHT